MALRVAAVGKPARSVSRGDGGEGIPGGGAKVVVGPCLTTAQRVLELGERLLIGYVSTSRSNQCLEVQTVRLGLVQQILRRNLQRRSA